MTLSVVGPLSPLDTPASGDAGSFNAAQHDWLRTDAPFAANIPAGYWVTRMVGSVTVTAADDNIASMLVRVYAPSSSGFSNLGSLAPGATQTYTFDIAVTPAQIAADDPVLSFYFNQSQPGTGYTIEAVEATYTLSDVEPLDAPLLEVENVLLQSTDIADLAIADLLQYVTLAPSAGYVLTLERNGANAAQINDVFDSVTDTYTMQLAPSTAPGVYEQEYRARVFVEQTSGEGGSSELVEVTSFAEGSNAIATVTFELLEGGGGGEQPEGCTSVPTFMRSLPSCYEAL